MDVILLSACQQATCSFTQRLPLLNILAVVLFSAHRRGPLEDAPPAGAATDAEAD